MTEQEIQEVLANIRNISAEDLFIKYILPKHIDIERMKDTDNLDRAKRIKITELEEEEKKKEQMSWHDAIRENTRVAFLRFLDTFPNGDYANLASGKIETIDKIEQKNREENERKVKEIKDNPNGFKAHEIKEQIDKKFISITDLEGIGIPNDILNALNKFEDKIIESLGDIPTEIEKGYTEIYFWGIPGSGKSCALAGILSYAQNTGDLSFQDGTGFQYANLLANTFIGQNDTCPIGILPPRTNVEETQYLPFHLRDGKGNRHPVALIELSGEIFKCYFDIRSGNSLSPKLQKVYDQVNNYLAGPNRKIHFFVIDLSKDPTEIIDKKSGANQLTYLSAAQGFFNNNNTFKRSTDGIYIIATKSDLLNCEETDKEDRAADRLKRNFPAFINELKDVCKNYKINDNSTLKVIPFSIGEVYFIDICKFNPSSSANIVKILKNDTGRITRSSRLKKFLKS